MKPNLGNVMLCAGCLLAALSANATPLQRADVAANPAWVLHLDCDTLRPTTVGKYILAEMEKPEAQAKLAAFQAIFSFDLRTQLHGLTLYSTGTGHEDGVLVVYADFDSDRLVTMAKAAQDHQSASHNRHVIHSWTDEKKKARNGVKPRTYAAIEGTRVIFGQREASVAQALDVLDKTVPNLAAVATFPQLGHAAGSSGFIQAAARKLDVADSNPHAAIFRLAKEMSLQVGEVGNQVSATLNLQANNEEVATNMASIAQGLVSLMKLQKQRPEAANFADKIALKQDGAGVVAVLSVPADEAVQMMKAGAARKAAKKAQKEESSGGDK